MIPSLPAAEESFWNGLEGFGRAQKISVLELNSFGSPSASIPMLGEEVERIERHEFVLRLDDRRTGLLERMQINHRQRARKGMKAGLRVRITTDPVHLNEHVRLIAFSMQRREAKGENVPFGASSEGLRPYLESGFCRIFQAILGEETVSSMMVAQASAGAYLYTSGTSPTGMGIGASHFLVHEIAQICQREGARVFNLGGVTDVNSGLGQYKRYFGAEMVKLEAAEFYVGNIWQKAISGGAQAMHGIVKKALRGVR